MDGSLKWSASSNSESPGRSPSGPYAGSRTLAKLGCPAIPQIGGATHFCGTACLHLNFPAFGVEYCPATASRGDVAPALNFYDAMAGAACGAWSYGTARARAVSRRPELGLRRRLGRKRLHRARIRRGRDRQNLIDPAVRCRPRPGRSNAHAIANQLGLGAPGRVKHLVASS